MTRERLLALLDEIDRTPFGPAEAHLVSEAVALAVDLGDEELEYAARLRQTTSANQGGDIETALVSFAWCLAHHDADPVRFPAELDGADLLWQFKWMASMLSSSPEFGLDQIDAVLDDMEAHYRAAGIGMSGVLMSRFEQAWDAGRYDDADRARTLLVTTPRDDYSHCLACTPSQLAGYAIERGDDAEALRLIDEMIAEEHTCGEEPEHALARSLSPNLRTGRLAEARDAHLRSYRLAKDNPANLGIIAHHIVFCAVTGNEARALSLIERHLPWLAHDALDANAHVRALSAIAVGLDAVSAAGHADTPVRVADDPALVPFLGDAPGGGWTATTLAARAWAAAHDLSARFDARNGTTAYADRLAALRSFGAERFEVPLTGDAFVPSAEADEPATAAERTGRARALASAGSRSAAQAVEAALADAPPSEAPLLVSALIADALRRDDEAAALRWLERRPAALRAAGREAQAALEQTLGLAPWRRGAGADVAALEEAAAHVGDPSVRATLLVPLALAAAEAGAGERATELAAEAVEEARRGRDEVDEAQATRALMYVVETAAASLPLADALLALPALPGVDDGMRLRTLEHRARVRAALGDLAGAQEDADAAVLLAGRIGASDLVPEMLFLSASVADDDGRSTDASARFRRAAELTDDPAARIAIRYRLAQALLRAQAPEDAVDTAMEVLEAEEAAEAPAASRADTLVLIARALEAAGEPGRAVGAWAYAAELFEEGDLPARAASALVYRAKLLLRFGDVETADGDAVTALTAARGQDDEPFLLADALHTLAQVRAAQGDAEAFALFDEAAGVAATHEADWLVADIDDSRARAHAGRGETDPAVACALQAADRFAAAGDVASGAGSELLAARVLAGDGRAEEAAAIYRGILDRDGLPAQLVAVAALKAGDVLESLGRPADAARARAVAES